MFEIAGSGFVVPVAFAGTSGKPHCDDQSVSALARPYRGLNAAAAALGYTDVNALKTPFWHFAGANLSFDVERHCAAFAARAIDNAEREILVGAYGLTTGSGIVEALVRAKYRRVEVRLIADKTTPCEHASGIEPLAAAGVPIWIDRDVRVAHSKTIVIDGAVRLMGSINWARAAAANSEDLNLVSSSEVAAAYAAHWRERLAVSVRPGTKTPSRRI